MELKYLVKTYTLIYRQLYIFFFIFYLFKNYMQMYLFINTKIINNTFTH